VNLDSRSNYFIGQLFFEYLLPFFLHNNFLLHFTKEK